MNAVNFVRDFPSSTSNPFGQDTFGPMSANQPSGKEIQENIPGIEWVQDVCIKQNRGCNGT